MGCKAFVRTSAIVILCLFITPFAFGQVHHDIQVELKPDIHRLIVQDKITLPQNYPGTVEFQIHAGLSPTVTTPEGKLIPMSDRQNSGISGSNPDVAQNILPLETYKLQLPAGTRQFTLKYSGVIYHPIAQLSEEYARSFSVSPGLISKDGIFLAGTSYWYPYIQNQLITFDVDAKLPAGWTSVSQGKRTKQKKTPGRTDEVWLEKIPQEEIYLIAAEFTEYQHAAGTIETMVFLRKPDNTLAQKYLDATAQYLEMYRKLIGLYPYSKFALVENFWETGYGMPSFTLLGPKVIRFPFIIYSSYPHEILHNYWGNGVYTDYDTGNWAEGLTSYLADHLLKEQRGQGVEYRRTTLQKYTDYVQDHKDFPLTEFRSRHSSATEAVGYGKCMMLFHMLRLSLGDETFIKGLRELYNRYKFKVAGFKDVETVFSQVAGRSLKDFFTQWVQRTGAPSLRVSNAQAKLVEDGFELSADIEQIQAGTPYRLLLPLAVYMEGRENVYQSRLNLEQRQQTIKLHLSARPVRLDVDPEFDVFRRLDRNEIPPSLSQIFGANKALIVLPSQAPKQIRQAYENLAHSWSLGKAEQINIQFDNEMTALPADRAVWLFGWENKFRNVLTQALSGYEFNNQNNTIMINGQSLSRAQHSAVVLARLPGNPENALALLATDNSADMTGLGRKLPHYGKYSYLAFTGDEPTNVIKGQWPVIHSPMSVSVTQTDGAKVEPVTGHLAPRHPLIQLPPVFSTQRMMDDIRFLASENLAGRGLATPELDRAADYIAEQFRAAGLQPGGDKPGSFFQTWTTMTGKPKRKATLKNIIGIIPATNPQWRQQSVVIGAHYDHLGRGWPDVHAGDEGKIHPGADDNASGVAVMTELARTLAKSPPPERSLIFVAFTGEEAGKLGSTFYTKHANAFPTDNIIGMLNLDTVGRLGNKELIIFGTGTAREWIHIFQGAGFVTGVPVKPVPNDFGSSDQTSFIEAGVPAVQFFSGANSDFHRPSDTIDKIDPQGLVKVTAVLKEAVEYLSSRPEPMTNLLGEKPDKGSGKPAQSPAGRRVTLGTVPDFTYSGQGVRLSGVTPQTPAEKIGLTTGDIITGINNTPIGNLRGLANLLRTLKPGDTVTIKYLRNNQELVATTQVIAR